MTDGEASENCCKPPSHGWVPTSLSSKVHGWRYSKPICTDENPCFVLSQSPPLVLAGDAFAGPRLEGAAISGWAAAEVLNHMDLNAT